MKKINLVYWDSDNFGDILNPLLVEELSGLKVQHKDILGGLGNAIRKIVKGVFFLNTKFWKQIYFPGQKTVVGMGSIISWANEDSVVWGSGFMNTNETFQGKEIKAVRGKYTAKKLEESGFGSCKVFGDPALLLPLWIKEASLKKYKLSIIPHWKEVDYFKEKFGGKYNVIDLRTKDVLHVINEITASEYILSTSLHGVIVPHAYKIPALWLKKGYIDTDGFKFKDYFSSVDIPLYEGFEDIDSILASEERWKELFEVNIEYSVPGKSLDNLQRELLAVAPFPLIDKYKKIANS